MAQDFEIGTLSVAASPHIRERGSVSRIMWTVAVALVPAGLAVLYNFGWFSMAVVATSVGSCVVFEAIWQKLGGKSVTVGDGSAVVTGALLGYVLPPNAPLFVAVVGSGVAILIAKQLFGGLGCNIWNPALVGRAFVQIAYPQYVTLSAWPMLSGSGMSRVAQDIRNVASAGAEAGAYDAVTKATPLAQEAVASLAGGAEAMYPSLKSLALGSTPGCTGETSAVLLALGGIYLIYKGYVNWKVPAVFLGTIFCFAFFFPTWKIDGATAFGGLVSYGEHSRFFFPAYQVLAGGAVIGAFFMATDMVTTPITSRGQVIFALGCGLITSLIRLIGHGFPEGVCYSILLMNTATPIIDRYTRPRKYGAVKK